MVDDGRVDLTDLAMRAYKEYARLPPSVRDSSTIVLSMDEIEEVYGGVWR